MKRIFIGLYCLFASSCGWAIQLSPMFHLLDAAGSRSMNSYQVFNPSSSDVYMEVKVMRISGSTSAPADDDFLILPPQGRIAPNSAQRFRIRYLGDMPEKTTLYRVIFEQINPTGSSEEESGSVKLLFKFSTSVMVSPLDCDSNLNASIASQKIRFLNTGNCVFDMTATRFEMSGNSGSTVVNWDDFKSGAGGYLMPGINVSLKLPDNLADYQEVKVIGQ
ncbi:hypothetical protein BCT61_11565 [Vibrio breoganii]|uniref:fimbrial biogenesis chaperone n=1 Tax=Vibrio breoganii TaxID=553239 RepID=UPI000CBD9EB6|nr:fimbria/pilus periplasmic chaperone [Vibrio breoganii]PMG08056.1 hypothetical protein BCV00_00685 [Vibrio breoganii]PMK26248.1 hypothetical protein BCU03_03180 [Vibrio breoganii]PMM09131.1 hypothetical protein BCT61_11565 [Vibrio breoganii]